MKTILLDKVFWTPYLQLQGKFKGAEKDVLWIGGRVPLAKNVWDLDLDIIQIWIWI